MERVIEKAIRAKQVIGRLVERTPDGSSITLHTSPNLDGLPDWVHEAWDDQLLHMTEDDSYTGLWIITPYGFVMRAHPADILVNHGGGHIGIWV
jgi:hypothetical protein